MLLGRIELPASPLPRVRSTTELQQHRGEAARLRHERRLVKRGPVGQAPEMANDEKPSREARLAEKLRENLRRRKQQARSLGRSGPGPASPDRSGPVRPASPREEP